MDSAIAQEILKASYWEHFKHVKDLSLIYPIDHHKRIAAENEMNNSQKQIIELK